MNFLMPAQDPSVITDLLAQASRLSNQQLSERLRPTGLSVDSWRILTLLRGSDGMSMGELAEGLVVNNPTLTKMVDRMVNDNLVYRVPDPNDRRKVLICVTDLGDKIHGNAQQIVMGHQTQIDQSYQDSRELSDLLLKFIREFRS